jgi:hypothetical protein
MSTTTKTHDNGGPAFPYAFHFPEQDGEPSGISLGMTLRDWFAGRATEQDIEHHQCSSAWRITREQAKYAYADAMLAARKGGAQ